LHYVNELQYMHSFDLKCTTMHILRAKFKGWVRATESTPGWEGVTTPIPDP